MLLQFLFTFHRDLPSPQKARNHLPIVRPTEINNVGRRLSLDYHLNQIFRRDGKPIFKQMRVSDFGILRRGAEVDWNIQPVILRAICINVERTFLGSGSNFCGLGDGDILVSSEGGDGAEVRILGIFGAGFRGDAAVQSWAKTVLGSN